MPTAAIAVNGTPGSNTDVVLGDTVVLTNGSTGGEVSFLWEVLNQPDGSPDFLSSPTSSSSNLTLDKEGTYFVSLTVNKDLSDEVSDKVVIAVRQQETRSRIPAIGETLEASLTLGWGADVNDTVKQLDNLSVHGVMVSGIAQSSITAGQVARIVGALERGSGTKSPAWLPAFEVVSPTTLVSLDPKVPLYYCLGRPDGVTTVGSNEIGWFRRSGTITLEGETLGAAPLDPIYLDDVGALSATVNTDAGRRVGTVLQVSDPLVIEFDGDQYPAPYAVEFGVSTSPAASATAKMPKGSGAASGTYYYKHAVDRAVNLTHLAVRIDHATHDDALTFTVLKNGSPTAVTITVAAATATGVSNPLSTGYVVLAAGDSLAVTVTSGGSISVAADAISATLWLEAV